MVINKINTLLRTAPNKPGVYLMKDINGKILYIGKAKSLKDRLYSYTNAQYLPRIRSLVSKIDKVEYIVTNSEIEALVMEADLIKLHLPYYNVRLKDDKKYPYIKITIQEDFPSVYPTRNLTDRSAIYFGPYTHVKNMKKALRSAIEIFPIRVCRGKLPKRACLYYYIKKCCAPCENKISKEKYRELVQGLVDLLSGKSKKIETKLKKQMAEMAEKLKFEEAAKIRDKINNIEFIMKKQKVVFDKPLDMDIFGLYKEKKNACITLIPIREGRIIGMEHYNLDIQPTTTDGEIIRAFFLQYYKNAYYIPKEIVVSDIEDKSSLEEWLKTKIITPKSGKKISLIKLANENAKIYLTNEKIKIEKIPKSIEELQSALKLEKMPRKIECFDVSNIFGKFATGSCVLFVDGKAQKSGYKRFRIKTVTGINDTAMIKEIISRRIKKGNLPDLILVDGGIGQVNAAKSVLPDDIPVFGLAKKFEQLYNSEGKIVSLPKDSSAIRLLQRIRDEAHRFAITYHKKLRDKPQSILDEIEGIGEKRKEMLLSHFGSFEALKNASLSEIKKIKGIGLKQAEKIYEFLHKI